MTIDFVKLGIRKSSDAIDPRWHAVSLLLANDPKLLDFLFNADRSRLSRPSATLKELARVFSSGEQVLVRTALDLWDESGRSSDADTTGFNR